MAEGMVGQEPMEEVIFICQSRKQTRCRCLQKVGNRAVLDGRTQTSPPIDMETIRHIRRNAVRLLNLPNIKDSHDRNDADSASRTRSDATGVSEHYIKYVKDVRAYLRRNGICVASCKYILKYRPCWLKKNSANAQESNINGNPDQPSINRQRTPLTSLETLAEFRCCKKLCSKKVGENHAYFQKLRDQACKSQIKRRLAARKLLETPPNEARNCIKFICLAIPINRGTLRNEIRYPTIESNPSPDNREQQAIGEKSRHVATSTCVANSIQIQMAYKNFAANYSAQDNKGVNTCGQVPYATNHNTINNIIIPNQAQLMVYQANANVVFDPNTLNYNDHTHSQFTNQNIQKNTININGFSDTFVHPYGVQSNTTASNYPMFYVYPINYVPSNFQYTNDVQSNSMVSNSTECYVYPNNQAPTYCNITPYIWNNEVSYNHSPNNYNPGNSVVLNSAYSNYVGNDTTEGTYAHPHVNQNKSEAEFYSGQNCFQNDHIVGHNHIGNFTGFAPSTDENYMNYVPLNNLTSSDPNVNIPASPPNPIIANKEFSLFGRVQTVDQNMSMSPQFHTTYSNMEYTNMNQPFYPTNFIYQA